MTDPSEIEITTRPFMGDLLGTPPAETIPAQPNSKGRDNPHLLAAATGRPQLHLVTEDDFTETAASMDSRKTRSRQRPEPVVATELAPELGYLDVDWDVVRTLTQQLTVSQDASARTRAEFDVAKASAGPETDNEQRTMEEIERIIQRHTTHLVQQRGADHDWTALGRAHYTQAIFDQAHRYGRLQQYLREPHVEDISVCGPDNVLVFLDDGLVERRPAIAKNEAELQNLVADIATYRGRSFAKPSGDVDLDMGGARLMATGVGPTSVTNFTVRLHNLVDIDLSGLTERGTITGSIETFLSAASRANLCVVVAGLPGTGKTTFLRALMSTIQPWEKVVTIETERELYLNKLPERHWQVMDLQYMPAQFATGDSNEGLTLQRCLDLGLRAKAERILFAEILSSVGPIAMKAMKAGKGSMSTIHALSAQAAIHRFAEVLMTEEGLSDDAVPLKQILSSVNLIIQLDFIDNPDGTRRRVVTEVAEVQPNDKHDPIAARLFYLDPDRGEYVSPENPKPELAARLRRVGYDWDTHRAARP